jgi:hypothetical protein
VPKVVDVATMLTPRTTGHAEGRRYPAPTVQNLALLAFLNGGSVMVSHPDRPKDFWKRVRPSPLMATLAMNMCTAADKAASRGSAADAAAKYMKAMHYFEPSLRQYADDAEMREWTERQIRALKIEIERLSS